MRCATWPGSGRMIRQSQSYSTTGQMRSLTTSRSRSGRLVVAYVKPLAQNVQAVALYQWLMIPAVAITVAVLAFNFLGDGVRDAADPYG